MTRMNRLLLTAIAGSLLLVGCADARRDKVAINIEAQKLAPADFKPSDVVLLKDGSRLIGEIQGLTGGKLLLKTDYAGVLTLEIAKVERIATKGMLNVRIKDGDRVLASLHHSEATGQEIRTRDLGAKNISLDQIEAMWLAGGEDPEKVALRAAADAEKPKWTFRGEWGINGQTGNSENVSTNARLAIRRETPTERSLLYFLGRYSRKNGDDSEKEFIGGGTQEVDISKKTFLWGRVEFENDRFEDISLRSKATAGVGRFIIREDDEHLKLLVGGGFLHEDFRTAPSNSEIVADLGLNYMKEFSKRWKYTLFATYSPSLEETREYHIRVVNALEFPLTDKEDWKFRLGIRNEYKAVPSPSADRRLDTMYFANIVWEFD